MNKYAFLMHTLGFYNEIYYSKQGKTVIVVVLPNELDSSAPCDVTSNYQPIISYPVLEQ